MDRKSTLILIVCGFLFLLWMQLTPKLYPPRPIPRTNAVAGASNVLTAPVVPAAPLEAAGSSVAPKPLEPEELLVLTNENAIYTFTSHGGGLKRVELVKYPESVACGHEATKNSPLKLATLNADAPQPVLALAGGEALTGDGSYKLSRGSVSNAFARGTVRAEKTLSNGLYLVKEFTPTSNYLVQVRTVLENRSGQALALPAQEWVAGTATPLHPQDPETLVGIHWYDGKGEQKVGPGYFENKTLGCFPGTPRSTYHETNRVAWSAAHNQFFFLALVPSQPANEISATRFILPPPSPKVIAADPQTKTNQFAFETRVHYGATNLAAGGTLNQDFVVYAGPKELRTLERVSFDLKQPLHLVMGYGGFFGFFSKVLLRSMNGLNTWGLSYGMAIIAITVIVKLLFWPLTAVSTRASKRMQALQPQMKALQDKFKDDPIKMQKKLMEFMRENKVSPMSGCWPVLLQFPVLIGFFQMVQSAIELRGASFLWACDLSKSDTIWVVPGLHLNVNPLPLLMGATMLWQARLMPPSPGMDPTQQKIMKYFPMIFLVILYNYSAGLTLYWTVQNLLSIAQMKLTKTTTDIKASPAVPAAQPARPAQARPQPKKKKG